MMNAIKAIFAKTGSQMSKLLGSPPQPTLFERVNPCPVAEEPDYYKPGVSNRLYMLYI